MAEKRPVKTLQERWYSSGPFMIHTTKLRDPGKTFPVGYRRTDRHDRRIERIVPQDVDQEGKDEEGYQGSRSHFLIQRSSAFRINASRNG